MGSRTEQPCITESDLFGHMQVKGYDQTYILGSFELPRGLLARAALHRLCGAYAAARADLSEVETLAKSGPMPLFTCDAALEFARLSLSEGDPTAAQPHLDQAAELIADTGYHRRTPELAALRARLP